MNDVRHAVGRLDERTATLREEVVELRRDVKGMTSKGTFWAGIGVVAAVTVTVVLGLGAAYWTALSEKFNSIERTMTVRSQIPAPPPQESIPAIKSDPNHVQ